MLEFLIGDTKSPLETYQIVVLFLVIVFSTVFAVTKALASIEKWVVDVGGAPTTLTDPHQIRRDRYLLVGAITIVSMAGTLSILLLWQASVRNQFLSDKNDEVTSELAALGSELTKTAAERDLLLAEVEESERNFIADGFEALEWVQGLAQFGDPQPQDPESYYLIHQLYCSEKLSWCDVVLGKLISVAASEIEPRKAAGGSDRVRLCRITKYVISQQYLEKVYMEELQAISEFTETCNG